MNKRTLVKELNSLCERLDHEYDINCGGCCFVAAVIAENLERLDISYRTIIYEGGRHYALKTKYGNINSDGYRKCKDDTYDDFECSYEIFQHYYNGNWNKTYDIYNNSFVTHIINKFFIDHE